MITILSRRHAAQLFHHLRQQRRLSRRDVADRLFVSCKTVANRERCELGMSTDVLIDTAHVLGFAVALVPQRHRGARPTGTGWPA
jgi:transcriptional regulator with XRE-family HTH domain